MQKVWKQLKTVKIMYIRTWQKLRLEIPQYNMAQLIKSLRPARGDIRKSFRIERPTCV